MPESRGRKKTKGTQRYQLEPQRKKQVRKSPGWFAPLMLGIMLAGVLVIVWNYTRDANASNSVLMVGLGLIAGGFFGITFWR
jgi:hypothetical protein